MTYRICPICDQKMTKPHYCSYCRQKIKNPLTIDVDYYLNERHPEGEHDCTYHDFHDESSQRPRQQTASHGSGSSGKTRKKSGKTPIFVIVLLVAAVCWGLSFYQTFKAVIQDKGGPLSVWSSIASDLGLEGTPLDDLITEGFSSWEKTPESGYGEEVPPASAYSSWFVETDEIIAAGKPCNGYGHFRQDAGTLTGALLSYADRIGAVQSDAYDYSDNTEDDAGYTLYNTVQTYCFAAGENSPLSVNSIQISSDTATGQLHSVYFEWDDADTVTELLALIAASLRDSGDWPLSEDATSQWLQEFQQSLPDAEYGILTPASMEDSGIDIIGGVIESGDVSAYSISIYTWKD